MFAYEVVLETCLVIHVTFLNRWYWIIAMTGHNTRINSKRPPCCFNNQLPNLHCALKYIMYDAPKCTLQTLQYKVLVEILEHVCFPLSSFIKISGRPKEAHKHFPLISFVQNRVRYSRKLFNERSKFSQWIIPKLF